MVSVSAASTPNVYAALKSAGTVRAGTAKNSGAAGGEDNDPPAVRQLKQTIERLKEQIARKSQELQRTMADSALGTEQKQERAKAIRQEMAMLQDSMQTAYQSLAKTLEENRMGGTGQTFSAAG